MPNFRGDRLVKPAKEMPDKFNSADVKSGFVAEEAQDANL